MDRNLWPLNPNSQKADTNIDWDVVPSHTVSRASPELFKQVSRQDCLKLMNKALSENLNPECIKVVKAIIEMRKPEVTPAKPVNKFTPVKERITEDMVLETIEEGLEKAKQEGDQAMVFKFSEALAKYRNMFNQPVEKGDVYINVVTGVSPGEWKQ